MLVDTPYRGQKGLDHLGKIASRSGPITMTLRKKSFLFVFVALAFAMGTIFVISQYHLVAGLLKVEEAEIEAEVRWGESALSSEIASLAAKAIDWSAWDDTYRFVVDHNQEYINSNLVDSTFDNLQLNLMIFLDTGGRVVWGRAFDLVQEKEAPLPPTILDYIASAGRPLIPRDAKSQISGVLFVDGDPMLITAQPILTSANQGPVRGTLIEGRYLNNAVVERLANQTHLSLTIQKFEPAAVPDKVVAVRSSSTKEGPPVLVHRVDANSVAGYLSIRDLSGKDTLLLKVDSPRDVYQQGGTIIFSFTAIEILTVLLMGGAIIFLVNKWILSRVVSINREIALIGAAGDLTARVSVSGHDELGNLSVAINRTLDALQKSQEERKRLEEQNQIASRLVLIGQMASGIAHEINNPLTGVIGFAQLLSQRNDIPQSAKNDLRVVNESAQRVAGIVKRLLTFARQQKPQRTYLNINDIVTETLDLRAYSLRNSNITVDTRLAPKLPWTMADAGQLQQLFLNLIVNAELEMQAAHGKGNLKIVTELIGENIKITVQDDGPGIPREYMDRLFTPFFTTRDIGKGTGLGLSICHGIVAEHKGRIYVESEPGNGASFIVELPVVPEEPELEMRTLVMEPSEARKGKILVVDDEAEVREFLSRALTQAGHEVETTSDVNEALDKTISGQYDLTLLDVKMPGIGGIELYHLIEEVAQPLARRIVFITGDVIGSDTSAFLTRLHAEYVTKPFDTEQLTRNLNRILVKLGRGQPG